jgi:hypothetical protein
MYARNFAVLLVLAITTLFGGCGGLNTLDPQVYRYGGGTQSDFIVTAPPCKQLQLEGKPWQAIQCQGGVNSQVRDNATAVFYEERRQADQIYWEAFNSVAIGEKGFGVSQYDCRQFRSSLVKYTRCNDGLREGGQQAVRNAYWQSEQQMRAARDVGRAYTNSR